MSERVPTELRELLAGFKKQAAQAEVEVDVEYLGGTIRVGIQDPEELGGFLAIATRPETPLTASFDVYLPFDEFVEVINRFLAHNGVADEAEPPATA